MSNLPPNLFGPPPAPGAQANHNQFGAVPPSQLPPGYVGAKQDANSNSSLSAFNPALGQVNNYNQSGNSSPAFNHPPGPPYGAQSAQHSPMRPPIKPTVPNPNQNILPPQSVAARPVPSSNASPTPFPPKLQPHQINDNAPPLVPSSHSQSLFNGPPVPGAGAITSQPMSQYPVSSAFGPQGRPPVSAAPFHSGPPFGQPMNQVPPKPGPIQSQGSVPFSGPPLAGPARNSPLMHGGPMGPPTGGPTMAPTSGPPLSLPPNLGQSFRPPTTTSGPPLGPPTSGPPLVPPNGQPLGPPTSGPPLGPPTSGPPLGPPTSGPPLSRPGMNGPISSGPQVPGMPPIPVLPSNIPHSASQFGGPFHNGPHGPIGPPLGPGQMPPPIPPLPSMRPSPMSGPLPPSSFPSTPSSLSGPIGSFPGPPTSLSGPSSLPPTSYGPSSMSGPPSSLSGPPSSLSGPPGSFGPPRQPGSLNGHPSGLASGPQLPGPPSVGAQSNMQGRYPPMPLQTNLNQHPPVPPLPQQQFQQQYGQPGLVQQMGQMSVTKQGFDQLWGHQMVDLMACRRVLPEYPEDPPEIRLAHQFADSPNCSPEIFRCTVNRIPDTNSLLQKSRLPLGILIHPFKDLNHLPVIQCTSIVRCRACRTYINPFVYFVDAKRWKCNLCYRVNDLPEEFQYDPVSKSYGDPSRRPEIKSATIEFIAPGEYMLRPPQPAVYLFLLDVSAIARESGYLQVFCDTLRDNLDNLPGDARTQVGFICYDSHIHYYLMSDGLTRPKEMTVIDIDDVFLPSPESLLVNLVERRALVRELLAALPQRHAASPAAPRASALGAALQAAHKLMAPTGGRITVFQTCLPNVGPGALQSREDPNARSGGAVAHLPPATDFYKRVALDCSGAQVCVDLFLLSSQYADLATLSGMSKFSGGQVSYIPLFNASRGWQASLLTRALTRYLTRKIGFEAVMRVRCTRGISIHTFHGNFFVRSTDLLSLPNVSPDAGFGMQLAIDESLSDLQQVCFQAALLYTSSKGERRIRVHTLALPIATNLTDVLHSADQQCIIGLLSKMAVDRAVSASLAEAREALMHVSVEALGAHRLAQNLPAGAASATLHAPASLRCLPLYLLALLKRKAFRTGTSTRLDDRVADMCDIKSQPLPALMRAVYPDLYPLLALRDTARREDGGDGGDGGEEEEGVPDPPRLQLSAERISSAGAYLLDDGDTMIIYVGHAVSPAFLSDTFGVAAFSQLADEARTLPRLETEGNVLLHAFIDKLNDDRPYASNILLLKDNSPARTLFTERLVDDRVESAFSYYEFLQHIKVQVK